MGVTYPLGRTGDVRGTPCFVAEPTPAAGSQPKLLDQVRDAVRVRHLSRRTEEAYLQWIRRYILFHHKRHPREMGEKEVADFLSALAVQG
ncbi:MAG: site-specific integrase, partial [Nitrospirota bacterium]